MESEEIDNIFKLLLIGDAEVGKSSILLRFADQNFFSSYFPTIGIDFKIKTIEQDGKFIKLLIWDAAGQERYRTITSSYYTNSSGFLYVFDLTNKQSFDHIRMWYDESIKYRTDLAQAILVGTKLDLAEERQVSYQEAMLIAEDLGISYIEVSALTGHNIDTLFEILTRKIRAFLA